MTVEPESRPLVLFAEDARDAREMYEFYLTRRGYEVMTAEDGHEARWLAVERLPRVILMDLGLPGIVDGWSLICRLRKDRRTKAIPIIVLSAYAIPAEPQRAIDAGCTSFLVKPCLPADVAEEVARVLGAPGAEALP